MNHATPLAAVAAALVISPAALAQLAQSGLLIPDSGGDTIGLYSAADGSLIDGAFIVDANDPLTYDFLTPKEAIQVGSEIFVSDQLADAIFIFDLAGNYLDKIDSGLDNVRGLAAVGNTVYAANGGSNNGAPQDRIVTIDAAARSVTGSFGFGPPDFSPFDVAVVGDRLFVSDIDGGAGEGVDAFAFDGTFLGRVVDVDTSDASAGPDFPQQVSGKLSDDGFLVAGFSPPAGVYEFDAGGDFVALYAPDLGERGVYELLNGDYLFTGGGGTFRLDPATGATTQVGSGNQYISPLVIPEPAAAGLVAVAGLTLLRRRR